MKWLEEWLVPGVLAGAFVLTFGAATLICWGLADPGVGLVLVRALFMVLP